VLVPLARGRAGWIYPAEFTTVAREENKSAALVTGISNR